MIIAALRGTIKSRYFWFVAGVFLGTLLTSCNSPTSPAPCPTVWEGQGDTVYNRGCVRDSVKVGKLGEP